MEYKKKTPTMEVRPRIREVSTAASGLTSPSPPTTADAALEDTWDRSRGENPAKKRAAEEGPDEVRQADADRRRAYSKMESTEKELREWMRGDPEPRATVTEQCLHPVITVKMKPSHEGRSGKTAPSSIRGCGRGGKCLRNGHLSPLRVLLNRLRDQKDSLFKATAVLNEAVRIAGEGTW